MIHWISPMKIIAQNSKISHWEILKPESIGHRSYVLQRIIPSSVRVSGRL